jgi:hypothetical protein
MAEVGAGMSAGELYDFDRLGYIVIRGFLTQHEVARLLPAVERVEADAIANLPDAVPTPPRKGDRYHYSPELGYHAQGSNRPGDTILLEDFQNSDPAFDFLFDHEKTMGYVRSVVKERPGVNNTEIRLRYSGNQSGSHGSGTDSHGR